MIHLNISLHTISNKLGIDRKTLREWVQQESSLLLVNNKDRKYRAKKTRGFVTNLSEEEEKQVIDWVKENRNNNRPISTKSLIAYACSVNKNLELKKYNAQIN